MRRTLGMAFLLVAVLFLSARAVEASGWCCAPPVYYYAPAPRYPVYYARPYYAPVWGINYGWSAYYYSYPVCGCCSVPVGPTGCSSCAADTPVAPQAPLQAAPEPTPAARQSAPAPDATYVPTYTPIPTPQSY